MRVLSTSARNSPLPRLPTSVLRNNLTSPPTTTQTLKMESSTQSSLEGSQSQSQSQSSDNTTTYQSLKSYPFKTDPEFATGLSIILSHPQTPASESEIDRDDDLVLQAKCFFYSRWVTQHSTAQHSLPLG